MADMKKIATRDSYGKAITQLGAEHNDIVVMDADLAGSTKSGVFRKEFPNRHFNCGIAEGNMMAAAAGMAAGEDSRWSSHQCCEDFALMRTIPGMVVMCPADDAEAQAAVRAAYEHDGPVYIRTGRLAVPQFHESVDFGFKIGKGEVLREGNDIAIIATGLMVAEAVAAADALAEKGIHARVINLCTIKPLDEELVVKAAKECGKVITCEEHNILGGLGEAVCGVLSEKCPTPVRRIGVNDEFGHSGPAAALLKEFGLSAEHIAEVAEEFVKA